MILPLISASLRTFVEFSFRLNEDLIGVLFPCICRIILIHDRQKKCYFLFSPTEPILVSNYKDMMKLIAEKVMILVREER